MTNVLQGWDQTYCLQFVNQDFDKIHSTIKRGDIVGVTGYPGTCAACVRVCFACVCVCVRVCFACVRALRVACVCVLCARVCCVRVLRACVCSCV